MKTRKHKGGKGERVVDLRGVMYEVRVRDGGERYG